MACGSHHSAFISKDGHVFSFGSNREGQLGINDPSLQKSSAPLLIADFMTMRVDPLTIACGGFHTALLTTEGEIYTWGLNDQGQCGHSLASTRLIAPTKLASKWTHRPIQVDCGNSHSAFVTKNGLLYTFGNNIQGQLGHGRESTVVPQPTVVSEITEPVK